MADSLSAPPPTGCSPLAFDVPLAARVRRATVSVPHSPAPPAGWPVVLAFHGGQTHPEFMRRFCGLDTLAAQGKAVVVYPAGTGSREDILTWNGGNCCGQALVDGTDDVAFARALLDAVATRLPVDARRIHATCS